MNDKKSDRSPLTGQWNVSVMWLPGGKHVFCRQMYSLLIWPGTPGNMGPVLSDRWARTAVVPSSAQSWWFACAYSTVNYPEDFLIDWSHIVQESILVRTWRGLGFHAQLLGLQLPPGGRSPSASQARRDSTEDVLKAVWSLLTAFAQKSSDSMSTCANLCFILVFPISGSKCEI